MGVESASQRSVRQCLSKRVRFRDGDCSSGRRAFQAERTAQEDLAVAEDLTCFRDRKENSVVRVQWRKKTY